ncbi:hypothetical protein, partial [Legionella sp. CNM-4043-24]|uniref:hypothetical protein n=1 Tax=Legionella sp. CNM-4043-24 TaxID=3421646 RepID=UPI00403A887B
ASVSTSSLCLDTHGLDLWFETHAGYYWLGTPFSRNQGAFSVSHAGADYLITNAIAAGLLTEFDAVGQQGSLLQWGRA